MSGMSEIRTDRLLLRRWRPADRDPFVLMNGSPQVMEFFPAVLSPEETDAMISRIEDHFTRYGFGPWAAELRATGEFIGYVGLLIPSFIAAFTPCVEIGWRLAPAYWGGGLATEGARAVVQYGFESLWLPQIVSFTVVDNVRSRRVMTKIGMTHNPAENFDHPLLPAGHPQRRHVLYRLKRRQLP